MCVCLQLYNVVVDTEETGKQLLQKGHLRRRYTIIPLNKISSRSIPDGTVRKAQSLVRHRSLLLLSLSLSVSLLRLCLSLHLLNLLSHSHPSSLSLTTPFPSVFRSTYMYTVHDAYIVYVVMCACVW